MTSRRFDEDDLKLLTVLANVAAIQMDNAILFEEQIEKQRFEREAQAAGYIQRRLLPRETPEIPGYRFHAHNTPCYEVGGDYFDCVPLDEDRWGVVLADVAGKGMGAALLMAGLQATYHAWAETGSSPARLADKIVEAVSKRAPRNRFVTAFFVELIPADHRFQWLNAGHAPAPLLVRASGEVEELPAGGVPLGVFPGFEYPVAEMSLEPGDFVFACSDGITEAENEQGEQFGTERLREMLSSLAGKPAEEIGILVAETVKEYEAGADRSDDLTYIVLQRES
jgi:sigma-B regulation protein RsbU (phosphoserine phosphatase)